MDDFAKNGFLKGISFSLKHPDVVSIGYLNGDPVPLDAFSTGKFDVKAWLGNHGPEQTRPVLDKVIAALKEEGVTTFAATGYCFGGRCAFDLAFDHVIKVAVKYKAVAKAPLLINSCTVDTLVPLEAQAQADAILGNGSMSAPGHKREYFDGCTHGFAVRGDMSDPKVKAGKEGAFKATVEFFIEHL